MLNAEKGDLSLRQYAIIIGISAAYLSDILRFNREPGPRILKRLGLRRQKSVVISYERVRRSKP